MDYVIMQSWGTENAEIKLPSDKKPELSMILL